MGPAAEVGHHVLVPGRQAVVAHSQAEEQPNPRVIENPSSSVSTDFPKKVRNSIFVMVSLGVTILIIDALRNII